MSLKDKYADLLKLGEELHLSGSKVSEEAGKLKLWGTAEYQLQKDKFWDKVKANDRLGQFVKLWEQRATNVNVDARSVTLNVDRGSEDAIRALDDIGRQIAALGSGQAPALPNPHGSVLPAALCDGQEGRGTSVDDGEDSRGSDPA